jgi:hypothetical protein
MAVESELVARIMRSSPMHFSSTSAFSSPLTELQTKDPSIAATHIGTRACEASDGWRLERTCVHDPMQEEKE